MCCPPLPNGRLPFLGFDTFLAKPVELKSSSKNFKLSCLRNLLFVYGVDGPVIEDLPAIQTHQVPVVRGVAFIPILQLVELEHGNEIECMKFVEKIVNGCKADSGNLLAYGLVDRAGGGVIGGGKNIIQYTLKLRGDAVTLLS